MTSKQQQFYRKIKARDIPAIIQAGTLIDGLKIVKFEHVENYKDKISFICVCGKEKTILFSTFRHVKTCGCILKEPHSDSSRLLQTYMKENRIIENINCSILKFDQHRNTVKVQCQSCSKIQSIQNRFSNNLKNFNIFTRKTTPCGCLEGLKLIGTKYGCLEVKRYLGRKKGRKTYEIECLLCNDKTIRSNQSIFMMKKFPAHYCSKCPDKEL